jgi:hypothetical protein
MGWLQVMVKPPNPGTVYVVVYNAQWPGGTPLYQTFQATNSSPLNRIWTLAPALYAVTISWISGYQNITGAIEGNGIIVNGAPLYYQVLGTPGDANGVSGLFPAQLTW